MQSVAILLSFLLLAGINTAEAASSRGSHPRPARQMIGAPPATRLPSGAPETKILPPSTPGTSEPRDSEAPTPAMIPYSGVNNSATNSPDNVFHISDYWFIFAAGFALFFALLAGYWFFMRKPEPTPRSYGRPVGEPIRPYEGATVASLSRELADMGDRLLAVESQLRLLNGRLLVASGERDGIAPRANENSWLGALDERAPPLVERAPVPRLPAAVTMPSSETIARLLREYASVVAQRAAHCEDFIARYSVQTVDRTGSQGQFALTREGSDLWAVPVDGDRATLWALFPGKDTIKRWSYLAAMNGSGAAERLNGAFEFVRGGDATLQVSSPAFASSQDRKLFKVVQPGKLSGIA